MFWHEEHFFTIISLFVPKKDILGNMKYREYLDTARRHLESCQRFFYSINWSDTLTNERISKDKIEIKKENKDLSKDRRKLATKKDSLIEQVNNWTNAKKILDEWQKRRKAHIELMKILIHHREAAIKTIDNVQKVLEERLQRRKARINTKQDLMIQKENLLIRRDSELKVKEEWLKEKQKQLKEKEHLLRDIYYLSGYIFESFIVFKIYEVGYRHVRDVYRSLGKNFDFDKYDVKDFIKEFTEFTKVDYYPRKNINGKVRLKREGTREDGQWRDLEDDEKEFLRSVKGLCAIEQHNFQKLFKMIQRNKNLRDAMFPPSVNIPLFFINTSPEVEKIINRWTSKIRYSDPEEWDMPKENEEPLKDLVNESTLKDILDICQQINEKIVQF